MRFIPERLNGSAWQKPRGKNKPDRLYPSNPRGLDARALTKKTGAADF